MMRMILAATAAILVAGCQPEKPMASAETSRGGLAYMRLFIPESKDVVIRIAWSTDWATRVEVNQAVPYIGTDLILAGGAEGFPVGEVGERLADLKAKSYLSQLIDYILGYFIVPKGNLDAAVEIVNAHLRAPTLNQSWLDRIRDGFAANMAEVATRPQAKGSNALKWAIFGNAPVRRALSVDPPDMIKHVTQKEVLAWHRSVFIRNGAKIVIAGSIDANTASRAIDAFFAGLPEGPALTTSAIIANFTPRRILLYLPEAETSLLVFIAPLPPTREGGESEDIILATALGGDEKSVLFEAVRTKLRASYGFVAALDGYSREHRSLIMMGEVETGKIADAEAAVRGTYAAFREFGPNGSLSDRKNRIITKVDKTGKDPIAASFSALMSLLNGEDPAISLNLAAVVEGVTDESIKIRLRDIFPAPDDFIVMVVSPDANALPGACVIIAPAEAVNCQ